MLPLVASATAQLTLVNGVDTVFRQTLSFPVPKPTGLSLGAGGLLVAGMAARRRRLV